MRVRNKKALTALRKSALTKSTYKTDEKHYTDPLKSSKVFDRSFVFTEEYVTFKTVVGQFCWHALIAQKVDFRS